MSPQKESRDSGKLVRIRCDTPTSYATFTRQCYDAWRDGCACVACRVIDSYEAGESSEHVMRSRMHLLHDSRGQHGDGIYFGQLDVFNDRRERVQ